MSTYKVGNSLIGRVTYYNLDGKLKINYKN